MLLGVIYGIGVSIWLLPIRYQASAPAFVMIFTGVVRRHEA